VAKKILVVEDDENFAELVAGFLGTRGFEVARAGDGEEALKSVALSKPDLVILDIMLPKKHGYEVCERLRERWSSKELPVLALTSKAYPADRNAAQTVGADAFLTKPCSLVEVERVARQLLGEPQP